MKKVCNETLTNFVARGKCFNFLKKSRGLLNINWLLAFCTKIVAVGCSPLFDLQDCPRINVEMITCSLKNSPFNNLSPRFVNCLIFLSYWTTRQFSFSFDLAEKIVLEIKFKIRRVNFLPVLYTICSLQELCRGLPVR